MAQTIRVNGKLKTVAAEPDTPLLWVLRDHLHQTGTKFGCGKGFCGACTVRIDGHPMRACLTPVGSVGDKDINTIEGLAATHPELVKTWVEHNVAQCGYCQSGQLMSAAALLDSNSDPSDSDIDQAMSGNICRCGTYGRIKKAIRDVSGRGK